MSDDVAAARPERPFALSGYHGAPSQAALLVATFDRRARVRRAFKGLAGFWGAMVVSVVIPVARFVLVPTFFCIGMGTRDRNGGGEGEMKLLRMMLVFIAGTVLAALGQQVLGITGMVVGSIAGIFVGYWAARRLMP
ncbi:MAG: hypothetical protein ABSG61_06770 [Gemmatimonadales bacterium]